jgi:hypothetical protein
VVQVEGNLNAKAQGKSVTYVSKPRKKFSEAQVTSKLRPMVREPLTTFRIRALLAYYSSSRCFLYDLPNEKL